MKSMQQLPADGVGHNPGDDVSGWPDRVVGVVNPWDHSLQLLAVAGTAAE